MDDASLRRALQALDPEAFERLVHELIVADGGYGGGWRKLRAPDGGADSVRLAADETADWVVQCKRYKTFDSAQRRDCSRSLASAMQRWDPERVTFALSLDFTEGQAERFREVTAPGRSTRVDVMTLTDLVRLAAQHTHVTARFVGPDAKTTMETIERAATMGGASLLTGADLIARAQELARFTQEVDPVFDYQVTLGAGEGPQPAWPIPPYLTIEVGDVRSRVLVHSWWSAESWALPHPRVRIEDSSAGRAALHECREANAVGEPYVFDARLMAMDLPPLFETMEGTPDLTSGSFIMPPNAPVSFEVTFRSSEHGVMNRTFELRSVLPASPPVDVAFACLEDGLWFEIGAEFLPDRRARLHLGTGLRTITGAQRMRESVRWYRAFMEHESVTVRMAGVESETTSSRLDLPPHDRDGLKQLETWLGSLAEVEEHLGEEFTPPDVWTPSNGQEVENILQILRSGRGTATFGSATITIPRNRLGQLGATTDSFPTRPAPIRAPLFGATVVIGEGRLTPPALRIESTAELSPPDPDLILVRLVPADPEVQATFELVAGGPSDADGAI